MGKSKDPGHKIRSEAEQAALLGLERLKQIFADPDTPSGDVFKGLSLLFERIYRPESTEGGMLGDFEIRLKT